MSKPLIDVAMDEFREAIRNVAIKFQLSNASVQPVAERRL